MTSAVSLSSVSRHFGAIKALNGIDLDIAEGEFFALLGPSGSGKTTCLRLIAGFEQPSAGHVRIFGEVVEAVPPYRRNVNTVFQDYALFPHMNVRDNVAFSLMLKKVPRAERDRAAEAALAQVKLADHGDRRPAELSGGQRQRVALARAIVNQPRVLLLDEPLGALDLKLREQMQEELKALQRSLGITFIFVTHDQGEALSMSDRVAVFDHGKLMQVGAPEEIYRRPKTRFVADFVGSSNVVPPCVAQTILGVKRWASLRPEAINVSRGVEDPALAPGTDRLARLTGTVTARSYLGATTRLAVDLGAILVHAVVPATSELPEEGETVTLSFAREALHLMEDEP